jgi:hypothetical protein
MGLYALLEEVMPGGESGSRIDITSANRHFKAPKSSPKSEPPKCQVLEHPACSPGYCHSIFTSLDKNKALKGRTFTSNDHVQDDKV